MGPSLPQAQKPLLAGPSPPPAHQSLLASGDGEAFLDLVVSPISVASLRCCTLALTLVSFSALSGYRGNTNIDVKGCLVVGPGRACWSSLGQVALLARPLAPHTPLCSENGGDITPLPCLIIDVVSLPADSGQVLHGLQGSWEELWELGSHLA